MAIGVSPEAAKPGPANNGRPGSASVRPEAPRMTVEPVSVEPVRVAEPVKVDSKAKKMGEQEELSLRITEGLSTLSGLLGNIDQKLATQNRQSGELAQGLQRLPTIFEGLINVQKSQLDALTEIRESVREQKTGLVETNQQLGRMPEMFSGLGKELGERFDRQVHSGQEVRESVDSVGKSVRSLADSSQRAQNTMLAEFRRSQDEHGRRLQDLVERERKSTIIVGALGFLVVVCLVLVLVTL